MAGIKRSYSQYKSFKTMPRKRFMFKRRYIPKVYKSSGELKGIDTSISGTVINTTNTNGSAFVLNLVQQGASSWNRVGRKTHGKYLVIKGDALHSYALAGGFIRGDSLRMVVVHDKQPSGGAVPTWDTIFGKTDQTGSETSSVFDARRYDNMNRFNVLLDKEIYGNVEAVPATGDIVVERYNINEYVKLKNIETVYSGQSSPLTIADISSGAIYIFFRSRAVGWDIDTGSSVRYRYTD